MSAQINYKQNIFLFVVFRDKSNHLLKYRFGFCLCAMLIFLSNVSNLFQHGNFLFLAYFGGDFCFHSNGESETNIITRRSWYVCTRFFIKSRGIATRACLKNTISVFATNTKISLTVRKTFFCTMCFIIRPI